MKKLEFFFDYSCPYSSQAYKHLMDIIPAHPQIDIVWCPCESHPRPDPRSPHSELCIQGMFYAMDLGADIVEYHNRMFKAAHTDLADIEDINVLVDIVRDMLDPEAFRSSLQSGEYVHKQQDANSYAFEQAGVSILPSCRMNGKTLEAVKAIGITKEQLVEFIVSAYL